MRNLRNLKGLLLVVFVLSATVVFSQTTRPRTGQGKTGVMQEKFKDMAMDKFNVLDGFDYADIAKDLAGLNLNPKALKAVNTKNIDLLTKASRLVKGGASFKDAFKNLKGLSKTNLKDLKSVLPKDSFKAVKPMQKTMLNQLKTFLLNKLG